MDIEALINEKIQRLQDLNNQMQKLGQQIGALQEQGKALHGAGLEIRGAINALVELKDKEAAAKKEAEDKAKGLILPDKAIVAPDGKTVLVDANAAAPVAETPAAPAIEAPKAPVTLEVQ